MIKRLALGMLVAAMACGAYAQGATCQANAAEKKLAGAAKKSFLTKCQKDAKAVCEGQSKEKKLFGAAKNSFEKKCLKDAVGE